MQWGRIEVLKEHPPHTVNEAIEGIERRTGIRLTKYLSPLKPFLMRPFRILCK
jgi:hypothetical protein